MSTYGSHITARRSPDELGFKATCLLLFPDSVGLGVGFHGSRSTQPTCRQMSTRPSHFGLNGYHGLTETVRLSMRLCY